MPGSGLMMGGSLLKELWNCEGAILKLLEQSEDPHELVRIHLQVEVRDLMTGELRSAELTEENCSVEKFVKKKNPDRTRKPSPDPSTSESNPKEVAGG